MKNSCSSTPPHIVLWNTSDALYRGTIYQLSKYLNPIFNAVKEDTAINGTAIIKQQVNKDVNMSFSSYRDNSITTHFTTNVRSPLKKPVNQGKVKSAILSHF